MLALIFLTYAALDFKWIFNPNLQTKQELCVEHIKLFYSQHTFRIVAMISKDLSVGHYKYYVFVAEFSQIIEYIL